VSLVKTVNDGHVLRIYLVNLSACLYARSFMLWLHYSLTPQTLTWAFGSLYIKMFYNCLKKKMLFDDIIKVERKMGNYAVSL